MDTSTVIGNGTINKRLKLFHTADGVAPLFSRAARALAAKSRKHTRSDHAGFALLCFQYGAYEYGNSGKEDQGVSLSICVLPCLKAS
jgi:hypothetical protein